MESPGAVLILASRRCALKAAWLALKPWERYSTTVAAVAAADPAVIFCYLTALRIWRLPLPRVPHHVHVVTPSPYRAGRLASTTRAAPDARTGLTGLENVRGYGINRHHWTVETVQRNGFAVPSLVQTVLDCIVRLELPEAVAVVDAVMGRGRREGEGLTRPELRDATACLPSAAKRRREQT